MSAKAELNGTSFIMTVQYNVYIDKEYFRSEIQNFDFSDLEQNYDYLLADFRQDGIENISITVIYKAVDGEILFSKTFS